MVDAQRLKNQAGFVYPGTASNLAAGRVLRLFTL